MFITYQNEAINVENCEHIELKEDSVKVRFSNCNDVFTFDSPGEAKAFFIMILEYNNHLGWTKNIKRKGE